MGLVDDFANLGKAINGTATAADRLVKPLTTLSGVHVELHGNVIANTTATEALNAAWKDSAGSTSTAAKGITELEAIVAKETQRVKDHTQAVNDDKAALQALNGATTAQATALANLHVTGADAVRAMQELKTGALDVARSFQQVTLDAQLATDAQNGNATSMQAGIGVAGSATLVNLSLAKATEEQTTALLDLLKAYGLYNAQMEKTISASGQFGDWLAQLKASFDSGALSVLAYKQALEDLSTQLFLAFGTATGKAKAEITSLIGVVNQLIASAGAGGGQPTDFSYAAEMNKNLNKP